MKMSMSKILIFIIFASHNLDAAQLLHQIDIASDSQKELIVAQPSGLCPLTPPDLMSVNKRGTPLICVIVTRIKAKGHVENIPHYLPVDLFINSNGSFKKSGESIAVKLGDSALSVTEQFKLGQSFDHQARPLRTAYQEFLLQRDESSCIDCLPCWVRCCFK